MKPRPISEIPERFHGQIMAQISAANRKERFRKASIQPILPLLERASDAASMLPALPILDTAEREYRFHPTRKFRFDYAWPDQKVAMEVDGGLFVSGGHSRGAAREYDMARDAEAMMLGWRVLRVSTRHLKNGEAARWVEALLQLD